MTEAKFIKTILDKFGHAGFARRGSCWSLICWPTLVMDKDGFFSPSEKDNFGFSLTYSQVSHWDESRGDWSDISDSKFVKMINNYEV